MAHPTVVMNVAGLTSELLGEAAPNLQGIVGARIAPGWHRLVKDRVGGVAGCTHLTEMLGAMGTVAFQTIYPARWRDGKAAAPPTRKPRLIDSCYALRSDGEVAKKAWPDFYTGS